MAVNRGKQFEEVVRKVLFYNLFPLDIKDEYLEHIAYTLDKGDELAQNIIDSYIPYHEDALPPPNNSLRGIIHQLKRFLCI